MTVRLLLVDDHPVVLGGLAIALSAEDDFEIVATADSVATAKGVLAQQSFDVGLVDIRLPDGSGLELLAGGGRGGPSPAWIVLSSFDAVQYLSAALDSGAAGYLLKTAPLAEVVAAIRRVAAGGTSFEAHQLRAAMSAGEIRLTPRERDVLRGVMDGRSNDEIASDLGLARKTVEANLTHLYARFGTATRTELALRAEREGWLRRP